VPVSGIEVSAEYDRTWIESGRALQLYAEIMPENASNPYVEWSVNEISGTAFIEADGLLIAGSAGEVEAVALARDGSGVSGSYRLTIESSVIQVLSIEIHSEGDVSSVDEGKVLQLYADVNPGNASNKDVFWHVSGSDGSPVGSITSEGLFIALGEGQVDVLAIAKDGSGVFDNFSVTVMGPSGTEVLGLEGLNIYPNPGNGLFHVDLGELNGGQLKVIDTGGAIVFEYMLEPGVLVYELDLSHHQLLLPLTGLKTALQ